MRVLDDGDDCVLRILENGANGKNGSVKGEEENKQINKQTNKIGLITLYYLLEE